MLIITAVGPDKPGMAHAVAKILSENGCNIEDTTMTRLSGQFSMILAVEPPAEISAEALTAQLEPLNISHGLVIDVTEVTDTPENETDVPRYMLTAYGQEKAGLLATLTGILAQNNVNVTDVQTRVASHGTVYVMLLEIELPVGLTEAALEAALQANASDLQISLRPIEEDTL